MKSTPSASAAHAGGAVRAAARRQSATRRVQSSPRAALALEMRVAAEAAWTAASCWPCGRGRGANVPLRNECGRLCSTSEEPDGTGTGRPEAPRWNLPRHSFQDLYRCALTPRLSAGVREALSACCMHDVYHTPQGSRCRAFAAADPLCRWRLGHAAAPRPTRGPSPRTREVP